MDNRTLRGVAHTAPFKWSGLNPTLTRQEGPRAAQLFLRDRAFVDQQFLSFPILVASERPRRDQLVGPVDGLPTSYLVAPDGEVVARQVGQITAEAIQGFIERYEKENSPGEKQ